MTALRSLLQKRKTDRRKSDGGNISIDERSGTIINGKREDI